MKEERRGITCSQDLRRSDISIDLKSRYGINNSWTIFEHDIVQILKHFSAPFKIYNKIPSYHHFSPSPLNWIHKYFITKYEYRVLFENSYFYSNTTKKKNGESVFNLFTNRLFRNSLCVTRVIRILLDNYPLIVPFALFPLFYVTLRSEFIKKRVLVAPLNRGVHGQGARMEETPRSFASNVAYFHVNVCGLDIPARLADRPVYHMLTHRRFIVAIAAVSQLTLRHSSARPAASDPLDR